MEELRNQNIAWPLEFKITLKESSDTPGQWEFVHPDMDERLNPLYVNNTDSLPMSIYPVTHRVQPEGILVILNNEINGAFHRYDDDSRWGKHFYIGSPYKTLHGKTDREWREFVKNLGAHEGRHINFKLFIFDNYTAEIKYF